MRTFGIGALRLGRRRRRHGRGGATAERSSRRLLQAAAVAICVTVGVLGVLAYDEFRRPDVPTVVQAARSPAVDDPRTAMARTVDGLGFPDWRRYSWTPVGGRRDRLEDDREAATVLYRNGARTITYTIISGTGNVDDEDAGMNWVQVFTGGRKIGLVQGAVDDVLTLKRERHGRTVVMTGKPFDKRRLDFDKTLEPHPTIAPRGMSRTMRRLAVRG